MARLIAVHHNSDSGVNLHSVFVPMGMGSSPPSDTRSLIEGPFPPGLMIKLSTTGGFFLCLQYDNRTGTIVINKLRKE